MLKKHGRKVRSTIFWNSDTDAKKFIQKLEDNGYEMGRDYKDIVEESALGRTGYVVWTRIPEAPYIKIMRELYPVD